MVRNETGSAESGGDEVAVPKSPIHNNRPDKQTIRYLFNLIILFK